MRSYSLIDFFKHCFSNLQPEDKEFRCKYWKNVKERKYYIKAILEDPEYRGKTKSEIESDFGTNESRHPYQNRWSYFVGSTGKKEYVLAFYFEDNILVDIRYEYKYRA